MICIKLKFFGVFRDYLDNEINIKVACNSNIFFLKIYLRDKIFIGEFKFLEDIFKKSIFSNEKEILSNDYVLKFDDVIYILPPFSGG